MVESSGLGVRSFYTRVGLASEEGRTHHFAEVRYLQRLVVAHRFRVVRAVGVDLASQLIMVYIQVNFPAHQDEDILALAILITHHSDLHPHLLLQHRAAFLDEGPGARPVGLVYGCV